MHRIVGDKVKARQMQPLESMLSAWNTSLAGSHAWIAATIGFISGVSE